MVHEDEKLDGGASSGQMLPAEFSGFMVSLAQTALIQLGELPEPVSGQSARNLDQAKYTIDLIDMLVEKTRGNLTEEEAHLALQLQKDLKLKYVRAR